MRFLPPRSGPAPRLFCALVLVTASDAVAQPNEPGTAAAGHRTAPPLRLSWSSSEPDCDGNLVAARAIQMVGPGVSPPEVEARAAVSREGPTWTVQLETRSENQTGTRVVRGETCKEIQDAVALLLAMILESEVDAPAPTPARPSAPPAPTPPSEGPSKPLSGVTPTAAATSETAVFDEPEEEATASGSVDAGGELGGLVRFHGGATTGLQPEMAVGVGAAAGVFWRAWDFAATASFWHTTRATIPERMGYVEIGRIGIGLRSCFAAWTPGDLSVAGCLLPEVTLFRFDSFGLNQERRGGADHALVSGTAALELRYRLFGRHVSAVLSPGITWEKAQPFHVRVLCLEPCDPMEPPMEPIEVHTTPGLGARLELGLDARF